MFFMISGIFLKLKSCGSVAVNNVINYNKMDKIMHSIITNISLFTCVGCFYYLTRIYQHNKWKKLFIVIILSTFST